jgi:hypothetical protein
MPEHENLKAFDIANEVNRFFDDSSLSRGGPPQIAIVCGPTATGKTRHRRKKYAKGYVVVDAADIFISLSRGKYIHFPSFLEEPMDLIGAAIAKRAIQERRNIVTEIIGHVLEPFQGLIDAMLAIGYKVDLDAVIKDVVEAWEWNLKRSDDNISAFYTEQFHRKWLIEAATENEDTRLRSL